MPASKKPRKKYVPGAAMNKAKLAKLGRQAVADTCDSVRVRNHEALASLTCGRGTAQDWGDIAEAINVALVLSETLYDSAYQKDLLLAAVGHAKCGERHHRLGSFGYSGEDLKHVNTAIDIHDAQLDDITFGELCRAHAEVKRRQATQPTLTPMNVKEREHEYAG